ncbi:MAG: DUF6582 domain-containing protein, partial [Janthinobacterium lividum]
MPGGYAFVTDTPLAVPRLGETRMSKLSSEERDRLDTRSFAFPEERKEPLENASHVRNAIARFNQIK